MEILKEVEKEILPVDREMNFEVGDTVKVHYRIVEGDKERIQIFEGIVIAIDNKGISKTFTVRKLSFDVGVERIFPFYSPRIAKIDVVRKGKKRRAKLYFLRERRGKSAKLKERRIVSKKNPVKSASAAPVKEPVAEAPVQEAVEEPKSEE